MSKFLSIVAIPGFLLIAVAPTQAAVEYTVTYLGNFSPHAINNLGEVVGFSQDPDTGYMNAVLYSNGQLSDLGSLGGTYNVANGINDSGQIVGVSSTTEGVYHAFSYSNGNMTDLGTLGGLNGFADNVNNSGQIVGSINTSGNDYSAYLLSNGLVSDIGSLGGSRVSAEDINRSGAIAGTSLTQDGSEHAFTYENGVMADIGTLGGYSMASAINDNGQIVGQSETATGVVHAFLYSHGMMIDVGGDNGDSAASDINNRGQIVGGSHVILAFLYEDGQMYDLNQMIDPSVGITLNGAVAINDNGQIVATDCNAEAFLLTPISEPSTIVQISIFLLVAAVFLSLRRTHIADARACL